MKKTGLLYFIFLCSLLVQAQQPVLDAFKNMSMRSIGPAVTSGRVTSIDARTDNPDLIYAGTASGGLWRSSNGGLTWEPLFDREAVIGIGAVKIDPSNPDIIWAGTGEGNPRNSQTSGKGIWRSPDGGRTWEFRGLGNTWTIHRICVDPRNSNTVYAGSPGSAWGPNPDRGVFKTTDGTNWNKVLFVNDSVGCADLVMDPVNPDKLLAAMWQYGRDPWFFKSGGKGSGLYLTLDGGNKWRQLGEKDGLPAGPLGRIGLAIAPSNPKVVYALIESRSTALYRSDDGGSSWYMVADHDVDDRPFYYHEIYVDPSNENHLIYLHSTVGESIDGGKTWKTILPYWGVHPDHHAFWWCPSDPSLMIEGNDGGLNISRDGGRNWQFASSLPLGQFYHIGVDMDLPYHVYGGMQDNGSWKGPAYVWHSDGIMDSDWQEVLFGDGFDVVPAGGSSRHLYAMYQGGNLYLVDTETGEERFIQPIHPERTKLRFNWNSGIAQDPFLASGVYYGSQFLHYSEDYGQNWSIISPDLTTNDPEKQKASSSGGLTTDATSAENHCTILTIGPSPLDRNVIWVGTDDGQIQVTTDRGKTWKNVSSSVSGMPKGAWVSQVIPSRYSAGEAFAVVNNYRRNDRKPYLFYTKDYGRSWKNLVKPEQVHGHCLSVVQDPVEPKLIFLGTEHGLFVTLDGGATWNQWRHNYPSVATQDLCIHPREHDLVIGTFGRAAYILDDIRPLRKLASEGTALLEKKLVAMPVPDAYQAFHTRHKGARFYADGSFVGENRADGVRLSYYFKIDKEEEKKGESKKKEKEGLKVESSVPKDKKVRITILSDKGDTVRWFTHEPDTGLNILTWHFDRTGVRGASRHEPKPDADPPGGGFPVPPGKYKVSYTFNDSRDSALFEVYADPRLPFNREAYDERLRLHRDLTTQIQRASEAFKQLRDARKTIDLVRQLLIALPDSAKKTLGAEADSLVKELDELEGLFMLQENTSGIVDDSHLINSRIWLAMGHIYSGNERPGSGAVYAIDQVKEDIQTAINRINTFFETKWADWRSEVEKQPLPVFKEVKRL